MRYGASFCNLESNSSIQLPKPVNGMWIILLYCHSDEFPREIPISTLFTRWFVHWSISPSWFYKNFNHFIIFWNKQKEKIELHSYQVIIWLLLHENARFYLWLKSDADRLIRIKFVWHVILELHKNVLMGLIKLWVSNSTFLSLCLFHFQMPSLQLKFRVNNSINLKSVYKVDNNEELTCQKYFMKEWGLLTLWGRFSNKFQNSSKSLPQWTPHEGIHCEKVLENIHWLWHLFVDFHGWPLRSDCCTYSTSF